ncbi:MAG: radical SAM protein [Candidatus Aminicenantes bacterium]|nr:radical SAM protein [Candidatus Aminicenantes bacterium]
MNPGKNGPKSQPSKEQNAQGSFKQPPILVGYTYFPEDAYKARDENRLLAIRLETNITCNLRCRYCYAESSPDSKSVQSYEALTDVVRQAHDLGLHSVVVIGGGEPTIHPRFGDLIRFISSRDIIPMIFTNTITMTKDLASFLYDHNASVMGKLDSLNPEVQDFLCNKKGVFKRIQNGLDNLMEAGFSNPEDPRMLRLGVSFVSCKMNLAEIEKIWYFCRQRNIFPNMEVLTPTGRARNELSGQGITLEEIKDYKLRILEVDKKTYGYNWLPYTPLTASGCLQYLYSFYITIDGDVRPCAPTKLDKHPAMKKNGIYPHNVFRRSISEIYHDSLFKYVRNIDKYLEGKCGGCEYLDECIGCRGYAYSVNVNEGKDPYAALRSECLQCFR